MVTASLPIPPRKNGFQTEPLSLLIQNLTPSSDTIKDDEQHRLLLPPSDVMRRDEDPKQSSKATLLDGDSGPHTHHMPGGPSTFPIADDDEMKGEYRATPMNEGKPLTLLPALSLLHCRRY